MNASQLLLGALHRHASNDAPAVLEKVRSVFSSGRKFAGYKTHEVIDSEYASPSIEPEDSGEDFSCNPFAVPSKFFALDLLTDSGTSKLTEEQREIAERYRELVPSIEMFSYARCAPREHLEQFLSECFGEQFSYYPALQGRAAEKMLLQATVEAGLQKPGDCIISNRPFDTTKGHICALGLHVIALTPLASPERYYESDSVFLGNIADSEFLQMSADPKYRLLLLTLTDNGGGGQPVSMDNFKFLVSKARERGLLVWCDACRIFENALFIKTFEQGYEHTTITDIVKEILSLVDFSTMSFKKMYSHAGGSILVNRASPVLSEAVLQRLDRSIKRQTTTDYGNGYRSYSGLTGEAMVEMMTGLAMACDEEITGHRIAQVGTVGSYLKQKYNLPVIAGGHALYIAADQVLPNVPLTDCPAETLNALMMASIKLRGCGLGLLVYGGRVEHEDGSIELKNELTMDSLRLAIPRNQYGDSEIISRLSIVGEAHALGLLTSLQGGLCPKDYVDDGFYHFGGEYDYCKPGEFKSTVEQLRRISVRLWKSEKQSPHRNGGA